MSDETYNGWTNYPTWCVNLWLGNDRGLYDGTVARVDAVLNEEHPTSEHWTVEQSRRFNTADALKTWVTLDLAPDLGASFPADLLAWSLDQVNWDEIADGWILTLSEINAGRM